MRFERYKVRLQTRPVTPGRLRAARKAVQRQADENALCPELVKDTNPYQRIERMDLISNEYARYLRHFRATKWVAARKALRSLNGKCRICLFESWNRKNYPLPGNPSYLLDLISETRRCQDTGKCLKA